MASREYRPRRPWFGADLRFGVLLAVGLAIKFAPPMLSAKLDKPAPQPILTASEDANRPPTDALTYTLPTSVKAPAPNEPSVLASPVFAEKIPVAAKSSPMELPKSDPLDPPKPPSLAGVSRKTDANAPPKPVKLRPPESIRNDPPIILADAPKKAPVATELKEPERKEPLTKAPERKGPIHPYFQRYLDQKEYYVRPGDTLASIAHRLYQDEAKAIDLLAANKDALPTADALKAGMTIKLP
jgi:nucleoid-associated protein YgaU